MADDNLPSIFPPTDAVEYDSGRLERITRNPRRMNNAVHDVFDLIGGVPRMAVWADQNPGEFYTKLLTRNMQAQNHQEHSGRIEIVSAVPRTVLDGEFEDVTPNEPDNT